MEKDICLRYRMEKVNPYKHIPGKHTRITISIMSLKHRETVPRYKLPDFFKGSLIREFRGKIQGSLYDKLIELEKEIESQHNYEPDGYFGTRLGEAKHPEGPFIINYGIFGVTDWSNVSEQEKIKKQEQEELENAKMNHRILFIIKKFAQKNDLKQ